MHIPGRGARPEGEEAPAAKCAAYQVVQCSRPVGQRHVGAARRCHCIAGYVVPRAQLAFMHPTEAGSKFAAAYSQGGDVLVYR